MLIAVPDGFDLDLDALMLTEAQRAALSIDRHVVVSAGAGSGKTHTLAWRYVRLLIRAASAGLEDLGAVVVLTFTEKAAMEMTGRCRQRLATVASWAREHEVAIAPILERYLDQFDRARIHTFHAFCARVAREDPSAVGLPLGLEILDPDEGSRRRSQSAREAIERAIPDPRLPLMLDTFGSRRALLEALSTVLERGDPLLERLSDHAADRVRLSWDASATTRWRRWLTQTGIPTLKAVKTLAAAGRSPFWHGLAVPQELPADDLALHRLVQTTLTALLNPSGELRTLHHHSVIGSKALWTDPRRYAAAKAGLGVLMERCADWPELYSEARFLPTTADTALLSALVPFSQVALDALERYRAGLLAENLVDFDQLQGQVVQAVLERPALRQRLREEHRWWMVDEFQDTDSRQWALVHALGRAEADEPADRVFLVGDVKQAIYGFRGGEVALFHQAAEALGTVPLVLPDNFRSRPGLIDWFNRMFPRVLPEDWDPIVAARTTPGAEIVWLEAETVQEQADQVCRWLVQRLAATDDPLSLEEGPPVAILLRTRTHLALWERTLREFSLRYQVAKGVGFWRRQEVLDVVNLLHAAVTDDRLSWVGALRTGILGASDQEVHQYVIEGVLPPAGVRWRAAASTRRAAPFPTWARQALVRLGAEAFWDGPAKANVDQLFDRLHTWDLPALATVERLRQRVEDPPREGEALPDQAGAPIVLLTVHASKGLEFPVVVVPELHRPPSSRPGALTVAKVNGQWVLATQVDDEEAPVQQRTAPALLHVARQAQQDEADAESARLLYVALTRAVDHLVLAGPLTASKRAWSSLLSHPPASTSYPTPPEAPRAPAPLDALRYARPPWPRSSHPTHVELVASDLALYEACAAQGFRRVRLGQDRSEATAASVLGTVLHGLLEDDLLTDPQRALLRLQGALREAGLPSDPETEARLEGHRARLARSQAVRDVLDAPGFAELGLRVPFPGGVLKGRIDRLIVDRERQGFVVIDYKSGRSSEAHALQLLVYGWGAQTVLRDRQDLEVVGGRIVPTGGGEPTDVHFDPQALASIPGRLAAIAAIADLDHAEGIAITQPDRPCETCPFEARCVVRAAADRPVSPP